MKIVLLNVLHGPFDKRVFQKIGRSLADAGHEVVSICPGGAAPPAEAHGVRFRTIPAAASKRARLLSVLRLVRLGRAERAGLYLAPEPESWVAALIIKATRGGKVVFDMHEHAPTEFAKFFPGPSQGFITWLTVRFMRCFARYTDHILLTRESFEGPWKGLAVPRTVVINSNHLQPACTEIPEDLRERFGAGPMLIHQGQFGDVRGSYQLLEAMKLLVKEKPKLRCIVLGDYVFGSEAAYRAAIQDAGLEEHLLLEGAVPYDAVPAYIALADLGLILFQPGPMNHTLAMPHKLFDYMREGKPVLVPDFAIEVTRIVNEAGCGRAVDVANPEAIAGAVLDVLDHPEEAQRLGNNGRRIVEEKYNWAREEKKLLAAIHGLG